MPFKKKLISLDDTLRVAKELSHLLTGGNIVLLEGNLGSGKTTLVKNICKNYGIENATSPSFAIVNEYYGTHKIFHFDFYRIKKVEELYDIGFDEYLNDDEAIVFIEWAELFPEILPNKFIKIAINFNDEEQRELEITNTKND
ncbi:MAG: tRNA (adenosine(37)-N6)-threonylcarbamoyltransferase complex ATPase subunit type 1 TsaE [Ignavibacteriae bacterium]|nr:tRNA (adenosine(37)-N6)-threonylcarbamoyltransferase complex ATPase subunit type 1 TsaE [Ignavibacteriota bacterium]